MLNPAQEQTALLTAHELAVAIKVDYGEVIRKAAAGTIPCYRWGKHPRFDLNEVRAALRQTPRHSAVRDVSRLATTQRRRAR